MTANEAKQKTDKIVQAVLDLDGVYKYIDNVIENTISNGEYVARILLDVEDVPYNRVLYMREVIKEHYEELGYVVTSLGFNGNGLDDVFDDVFEISWKDDNS